MGSKAFKFRLYPTKKQEQKLFWTLTRCREVYNAALTERRDAYNFHVRQHPNYYDEPTRKQRTSELTVGYYEQKGDLPEIKAELREEYQDIHSQVLQDVLLRLEKAFKAFFRRVKNGEEPGYPVRRIVCRFRVQQMLLELMESFMHTSLTLHLERGRRP